MQPITKRPRSLLPISLFSMIGCATLVPGGGLNARAAAQPPASFVGSQTCIECHRMEFERWRGSHHDLAMTKVSEATVLGDFNAATFTAHGITSEFFRRDGDYFVRTDGPDGQLRDYRIHYTFGWWPLQQYLIALPGGRLQSFGIAWDSRTAEDGGQRWFHLYPDEPMDHKHRLHWTARDQNWNYQCAECHSTNLSKHYDLSTDSFQTTWSEIDVACEACHGPASRHLELARAAAENDQAANVAGVGWETGNGLLVDLGDRDGGVWTIDPDSGLPKRSVPRQHRAQIETCARCHSRRGQIDDHYAFGQPLGNSHRLALLDAGLYHADGQIQDEVYVYGSFMQSRMYEQGVTCTDCHEAHSLQLKAAGDLVCFQCHQADRYTAPAHHHHTAESTGASCTACHMPQHRYMVADERADHSLRIPRPDLSLKIGTPNACNGCHSDQTSEWAANAFKEWYGDTAVKRPHFGEILHAGREAMPGAGDELLALAADTAQPAIVRATALDLLRRVPDPAHLLTLRRQLKDTDPLVRGAAVRYLETTDAITRLDLGGPLLADPILAVRTDAARTLAPLATMPIPDTEKKTLEGALEEYRATQLVNAERPESHMNIGLIEVSRNDAESAERAYRTALRLDPHFGPAYVNLADLYRALGRDRDGAEILRAGIAAVPDDASLHHAMGLLLIRENNIAKAVEALTRAAQLEPSNAHYALVQALALQRAGNVEVALGILRTALERHPDHQEILVALVTMNQAAGNQEAARDYARKLQQAATVQPGVDESQRP